MTLKNDDSGLTAHPCDVCGSMDAAVIEAVLPYTGGQEVHTCKSCGFVFAQKRRSDDAIREDWAKSMFRADGDFDVEQTQSQGYTGYTAKIPAVVARLTYALENFESEIGFGGKAVCDVGAGEGDFLCWVRDRKSPRSVFGVEPSEANCKLLERQGIPHFVGGIEEFVSARGVGPKFDVVTLSWTLENTQNARRVLELIAGLLPVGGYLQVTTGSRILVPFRKPLHYYFNPRNPVDLHSFHFSHNSLCGLMAATGFEPVRSNRFIDTDYLSVIGRKQDGDRKSSRKDDYRAVIAFFERWKAETEAFYRDR